VSESLAPAYAASFERLPGEAVLNIDGDGSRGYGPRTEPARIGGTSGD